jgi:hypothetical protein
MASSVERTAALSMRSPVLTKTSRKSCVLRSDLVEVVAELKQVICVKGNSFVANGDKH